MMRKSNLVSIVGACALFSAVQADVAADALALAERTYAYVAKSVDAATLKPYRAELRLDAEWLKNETNGAMRAGIGREIARLRRRILFLHPDLAFDRLLCVQRGIPYGYDPHMVDQYTGRLSRPGPGLTLLENWKTAPKKKAVLSNRLPAGTTLNPDLHWEADRVIFSFCDHTARPVADVRRFNAHADVAGPKGSHFTPSLRAADPTNPLNVTNGEFSVMHRRYFVYEAALDGSWVRQVTGAGKDRMATVDGRQTVLIEDIDPCYLPDGGFAFCSTRGQNFGRCHWGRWAPSFLLYRGDLDGANIRPLSHGEANEWEPTVLNDGRIGFTRWDYINRNAVWHQSLWAIRPDGTGTTHLYGNYSENVCVGTELKAIPFSPLVIATAAAHHNYTAGSLFLLDPAKGEDGLGPVTRLTPECPFPEGEKWKLPGVFASPMPVNDTLFFCAYADEPVSYPSGHPRWHAGNCGAAWPTQAAYGIYLVDTLGGRELIFKDPEVSTFNPIPVVKRKRPPVLASVLPPRATAPTNGICYVENVYDTRTDLPKGSVTALRINRILPLPVCRRRTTAPGPDVEIYKETLGIVPVCADGSAAFRIPAECPIQLQALDREGQAILTMRSFIFSQRGEVQGCVGCHENKAQAARVPAKENTQARRAGIVDPVPEVDLGYAGAFSFTKSVQPIFDGKCISCHGLSDKTNAPFSLIGFTAVSNLVTRKLVSYIHSYRETHVSKCYDYFAGASKLTKVLRAGHGPKLTPEEWKKLILWMDFNVSYHAVSTGYGWNEPDCRAIDPKGEKALRDALAARLGEKVAAQPFDALVNRGDTRLSRALTLVGGAKAPDYATFLALTEGALKPLTAHDKAGTCGRDAACACRSCWVRAGGFNDPAVLKRETPPRFVRALPVWPQGQETVMNTFIGFRATFEGSAGEKPILRVTGCSDYRITLNGTHVGWGPARAAKGFFRVDEIPLAVTPGRNVLAIEVAGYNSNSFCLMDQPAFLQAEVEAKGRILAATGEKGDFEAVSLPRVQKVGRYSYQRPFGEAYRVTKDAAAWKTGGARYAPLALREQPPVRYLPRRAPYAAFTCNTSFAPVSSAAVVVDDAMKTRDVRFISGVGCGTCDVKGYRADELEVNAWDLVQRIRPQNRRAATAAERAAKAFPLAAGASFLFAADHIDTGFPGLRVTCRKPGRLVFKFDEVLSEGEVSPTRYACANSIVWDFPEPGTYAVEAFEPYAFKFADVIALSGAFEVSAPYLRTYKNAWAGRARISCSDPALVKIFEAARETFAQNAADVFTDCPGRERAGWLCDSFFTARSSALFTGSLASEDLFLENYVLPERFDHLPDGMFAMCYPGDFANGNFIPNWAMWLVLQVEEYQKRGGNSALVAAYRPRFEKLVRYLKTFRNADGLLEKLPKWVFVEWSRANKLVQDVNYPSNMCWAEVLDAMDRMYGLPELAAEAARVRETIRRQSFTGTWFCDNAVRQKDGSLKLSGECTETCQYYAFYFKTATPETHPALWKTLVDDFGPKRRETGKYPEIWPSNAFIGNYVRLECLARAGLAANILEETKGFFLYMAERTGTLWENIGTTASCNHGFASHAAVSYCRDILGVKAIDRVNRTVTFAPPGNLALDHLAMDLPLADGTFIHAGWRRTDGKITEELVLPPGWRRANP